MSKSNGSNKFSVMKTIRTVVWVAVAFVLIAAVGRYVLFSGSKSTYYPKVETVSVSPEIPWDSVNKDMVSAFKAARDDAMKLAEKELDEWMREIKERVDKNFLPWYFGYWTQQLMVLKKTWWSMKRWFDGDYPPAAEEMAEYVQKEFAVRVLRPEIAQLRLKKIVRKVMNSYVGDLRERINKIPEKYRIKRQEWQKYLGEIAHLTVGVNANREVDLLQKVVFAGIGGTTLVTASAVAPLVVRITPKLGSKVFIKTSSKLVEKLAAKTAGKVLGKVGGVSLGCLIGVAIIAWDFYDHYRTKKTNLPILRKNLFDFLDNMKDNILNDEDTGIAGVIDKFTQRVVNSLRGGHA